MPISRPYKLTHADDKNIRRLVIATSPAQAIRHVSRGWEADPASALEVATWMGEHGIPCEDATGGAPKEDPGVDDVVDDEQQQQQEQSPLAAMVTGAVQTDGMVGSVLPSPAPAVAAQ